MRMHKTDLYPEILIEYRVSFNKTYDSIDRQVLMRILKKRGQDGTT